jgi:hypothetical protein
VPIRAFRGQIFPGFPMALPRVCGSSPHESMAAQHEARGPQTCLPAVFRPDRRRIVKQSVFFFLLGQPGEFGVEGMIGRQKRLLPMQDRRVRARSVIEAVNPAGTERELDAALKCRVRVGLEIGILQLDQYFWSNSQRSARVSRLSITGSLHRSHRDVGMHRPQRWLRASSDR